jgi:tRNA dimethylallyltransferase
MFDRGLLEEVRGILALGYPATSKALEAHGYRQAVQAIAGQLELAEALLQARRNTRRYAKRQWTWFRRDPQVRWLPGFGDDAAVRECALAAVAEFLVRD